MVINKDFYKDNDYIVKILCKKNQYIVTFPENFIRSSPELKVIYEISENGLLVKVNKKEVRFGCPNYCKKAIIICDILIKALQRNINPDLSFRQNKIKSLVLQDEELELEKSLMAVLADLLAKKDVKNPRIQDGIDLVKLLLETQGINIC